ncbi:unnamed protein product [Adineta steineri]|uniref:Uncharacterized protein n=1 Tax=Adineta steineri TaxID=433720 RepID=A0A815P148_9BILA|nr:unnamed protein product [Adineta steineri]CAF1129000.1 unnamed protein product [Adineta steineri]CAF1442823.1 unnamed protein product [Adineta steineri]CAF1443366.1 unnamed protein product [Adineta steineri]
MICLKLKIFFSFLILFQLSESTHVEEDYDYGDNEALEECPYEIDFKTYKKSGKLDLCSTLVTPSLKTRLQLHVYANHTEERIHIRAVSSSLTNSNLNKSLLTLTTDIIEDLKYATSLLIIDDYQLLSLAKLQSIVTSLINIDLNLLSKNLKKILILAKGGHKDILSCSGNIYPKQDAKKLNITSTFIKPIACTKEKQQDKFFTLQEKIYLDQNNQKTFQLVDIHQDDQNKISRTTWYTCNNPASCSIGVQNKKMLDKTVNYVLKSLQKGRTKKFTSAG